MSTKPGASTSPSRSISVAPFLATSPTAVMRPCSTPTSTERSGPPVPSTTRAPRRTRSMESVLLVFDAGEEELDRAPGRFGQERERHRPLGMADVAAPAAYGLH